LGEMAFFNNFYRLRLSFTRSQSARITGRRLTNTGKRYTDE
jgi:hypothetical protein